MTTYTIPEHFSEKALLSECMERMANHDAETALDQSLAQIATLLQADYYHYVGSFAQDQQASLHRTLSNFPNGWNEYYSASKYEQVDPVLMHSQLRLTPVIWNDLAQASSETRHFMEEARRYGIADGVSFPVHAKNGDLGVLTFAIAANRANACCIIERALVAGSLAATCVHDAMRRLVDKERKRLQSPLTHRELECLHWIAIGKSNWEISRILGISEHGVVYYVRRLFSKFGVTSRYQAVARATACGLL